MFLPNMLCLHTRMQIPIRLHGCYLWYKIITIVYLELNFVQIFWVFLQCFHDEINSTKMERSQDAFWVKVKEKLTIWKQFIINYIYMYRMNLTPI